MVYRFRNCKNMLENKELEENYFFFASPEEQNDPMEGYIDYYWEGDGIAWIGLFKNYVWQLYNTITFYIPMSEWIHKEDELEYVKQLNLTRTEIHTDGMPIKAIRKEIEDSFFYEDYIYDFAVMIGNCKREITASELTFILSSIHTKALKCVNEIIKKTGMEKNYVWLDKYCNILKGNDEYSLDKWCELMKGEKEFEAVANSTKAMSHTMELVMRLKQDGCEKDYSKMEKIIFILLGFSENYVRKITGLSYAAGYSISFTEKDTNPAMWGYYADGHRGVALIFDYDIEKNISLECFYKKIAQEEAKKKYKMQKIDYVEKFHREIFFHTLGNLWGDEREHWFVHNGKRSSTISWVMENSESWREEYYFWQTKRLLKKNVTSKGEDEYRIVIDDTWEIHKNPGYRRRDDENNKKENDKQKYRYDFNDLKGIVFGLNTPTEDKLKVIEIVSEKCKKNNRTDFSFYQAYFDCDSNEIKEEKIMFG